MKIIKTLPWEDILNVESLDDKDVVAIRVGSRCLLEVFRYFGRPKYHGAFFSQQPTSNHSFAWPIRGDYSLNVCYRPTHFLRVARIRSGNSKYQYIEELNVKLPWRERHTRAEFSYNLVQTESTNYSCVQPKCYFHKPSHIPSCRWEPANGYGTRFSDSSVSRSLVIMT